MKLAFVLIACAFALPVKVMGFSPSMAPRFAWNSAVLKRETGSSLVSNGFLAIDVKRPSRSLVSSVELNAKKKSRKGEKKGSSTVSKGDEVDIEQEKSTMSSAPPEFRMDMPLPIRAQSLAAEEKDVDVAVKKLLLDRSLEQQFSPIPKGAIVEDPKAKQMREMGIDEDAAFGLSGDVMRKLKNGTWACIALLIFVEVIVQTPIADGLRKANTNPADIIKGPTPRAEGELVPGLRPWAPILPPTPPRAATTATPSDAPTGVPSTPGAAPAGVPTAVAPAPNAVAPAPTGVAPAPTAVAPAPSAVAPAPSAVAPAPTAVAPAPSAVAPAPSAVAPAPTAVAPAPSAVAPAPTAVAPAPSTVAPAPTAVVPAPSAVAVPVAQTSK